MKGSSYQERDYVFGQVMLTARTKRELGEAPLAVDFRRRVRQKSRD